MEQEIKLQLGLSATVETVVTEKDTAMSFGSGVIDVFSTPSMIGLMEKAALSSVDLHLPKGYVTVGSYIDVRHIAATPIGMKVRAYAELIKIEGRSLTFKVEAFDEVEKIGEGIHQRHIVNIQRFLNKTYGKLQAGK